MANGNGMGSVRLGNGISISAQVFILLLSMALGAGVVKATLEAEMKHAKDERAQLRADLYTERTRSESMQQDIIQRLSRIEGALEEGRRK